MKNIVAILTAFTLILISCTFWTYKGFTDVWWHRWFLLLVFCTFVIAYKIYKYYHISIALIFFYTVFSGLLVFSNYDNIYSNFPYIQRMELKYFSAYATFTFVMLSLTLVFLHDKLHIIRKTLAFLCIANVIYVLYQILFKDLKYTGGMWGNESMNGSLIACTLPLLLYQLKTIRLKTLNAALTIAVIILTLLAIAFTKASVPVGALSITLIVYLFFTYKLKILKTFIPLGLVLIMFLIASKNDAGLFSSSNRFKFYNIIYKVITKGGNEKEMLLGWGSGTTQPIDNMVQGIKENDYASKKMGHMMWMHNDWLQLTFEGGLVMAILALWLSLIMVYQFWRRKEYHFLAGTLSYMGAMLFSYHLHFSLHAFVGMYFVAEAFKHLRKGYLHDYNL